MIFIEDVIYLTPCVPLSFKGEGEGFVRGTESLFNALKNREVPPLFNSPCFGVMMRGV